MARQACRQSTSRQPFEPSLDSIIALLDRTERERSGLFWAEGCRSFFSALQYGWTVQAIVICPKLLRSREAWSRLPSQRVPILRVTVEQFAVLSRRNEPDGIGVVCEQRWSRLIDQEARHGDVWIALDEVRTPGNFGTILRTGAAVGTAGVMLIGGELDAFDPAAIRASMGALFATRLVRTSAKALAGWKERRHVLFVGTSPEARLDYREAHYRTPLVLMMGSERTGLRDRQIALCDQVVRLPMTSKVDSLNLAVATSIMLYAVADG